MRLTVQAFEYLTMYKEAMGAYRAAGLWRETLFCAARASVPEAQMKELAIALAEGLYEAKDYANAAYINLDYGQDVESAARAFCKGYLFADAMRVVMLWEREDLLEAIIDQGLVDGFIASVELLADCKGQLLAQVPRLRELRSKGEEDPRKCLLIQRNSHVANAKKLHIMKVHLMQMLRITFL